MTAIATIIDWVGPYRSVEEGRDAVTEFEISEALYFAIGTHNQDKDTLQYVGISNDAYCRLTGRHHALPSIKNLHLWIGAIATQTLRRRKGDAPTLHAIDVDLAEHAMAFLLELPLNVRKRGKPPTRSIVIYNRWFNKDFESRRLQRAHYEWPEMIEFDCDGKEPSATLVFFTGDQRVSRFTSAQIEDMRISN